MCYQLTKSKDTFHTESQLSFWRKALNVSFCLVSIVSSVMLTSQSLLLSWDNIVIYRNLLRKENHSECRAVVQFSQSGCNLSLAAWLCRQTQVQFIGSTRLEKQNYPAEDLPPRTKPHFYTDVYTLKSQWPRPLCLSLLHSGHVLTFGTDLQHVHAGSSHACHYPVWMFYLLVISCPAGGEWAHFSWGSGVCAFLKWNPKHTTVLLFSCWLANNMRNH